MSFGNKIRDLREDAEPKLTQAQLGEICGISQRKLSYIEKGETEPSLEDIRQLCKYFKVSADYFLELPRELKYPER